MITFKQFLLEGGAATAEHGTERANKADIEAALKFVSKHTGVSYKDLVNQLLGSTGHTLAGKKKDSGDLDIAMHTDKREQYDGAMTKALGVKPRTTGANVSSFPVPTIGDKKVQVDFMYVPDIDWAKFSYHSEHGSAFKGSIRNMLIFALVKNTEEKDKDVRLQDKDGNDLARASRSFQLDSGYKRSFKVAKYKKNGEHGGTVKATPAQVQAVLDKMGSKEKFDSSEDTIRDPNKFAKMLLGSSATSKDLQTSAENLISTIRHKRKDYKQIFKDAFEDLNRQKIFDKDPEGRKRFLDLTGLSDD